MIGRINYRKEYKGTDKAFQVQLKEKKSFFKLFDTDAYVWREVGTFKSFDDAEEWLLSRNHTMIYHGVKMGVRSDSPDVPPIVKSKK